MGLVLAVVTVAVVVTLEVWARPPGWLHGPRSLVTDGLHWLRVHWLTSGALGVLLAGVGLLLGLLQRRSERRSAEREEAERTGAAQAAREALLAHSWVDETTHWLPVVSDVHNPIALGVHPAADLSDPDTSAEMGVAGLRGLPSRVPVYVPRDLDAKLDTALARALAQGGLVLLHGDSTAGKSRTAFEAMRRLPGRLWLLVPRQRGSLRALLDGGIKLRDVIVWLNDLERYLGVDGLDVGLLRRLISGDRRVLVLATMRAREYNLRSPERERDHSGLEGDVLRTDRELLDQAVTLEVQRQFSKAELQQARERAWDPRIADALTHADQYGLAEYLAAGPRLWTRWRNGRAVDNPVEERVGAAIVAAALDCRRAGFNRPVPIDLLRLLCPDPAYLDRPAATRLTPALFEKGMEWATTPVQATSALLTPDKDGYMAFDYLVDTLQNDPNGPAIPRSVWERLLAVLRPMDIVELGVSAYEAGQWEIAERAWRKADAAEDFVSLPDQRGSPKQGVTVTFVNTHRPKFLLGLLARQRGDLAEAERWYRQAADEGSLAAANNLGFLAWERGDLAEAERWYRQAATARYPVAEHNLGVLARGRGELEEAERWWHRAAAGSHHDAEDNLGVLLAERGDLKEAEEWWRRAADAGNHDAEMRLGVLARERGDLKEAERWYRQAAEGGNHDAENNLGFLAWEQGDLAEAERWYRQAATAGHSVAENNLGVLARDRGELEEAERWWRRAAAGGQHDAEDNLGVLARGRGELEEAERWWHRAAEAGHHDAENNLGLLAQDRADLKEAEEWWRRAAGSHHDAENNLGVLLAERGDLKEAEEWWRRAAEAGHHDAKTNLRILLQRPGSAAESSG
jgi:hypothetical protein